MENNQWKPWLSTLRGLVSIFFFLHHVSLTWHTYFKYLIELYIKNYFSTKTESYNSSISSVRLFFYTGCFEKMTIHVACIHIYKAKSITQSTQKVDGSKYLLKPLRLWPPTVKQHCCFGRSFPNFYNSYHCNVVEEDMQSLCHRGGCKDGGRGRWSNVVTRWKRKQCYQ